jgi:hypothetical protein
MNSVVNQGTRTSDAIAQLIWGDELVKFTEAVFYKLTTDGWLTVIFLKGAQYLQR